ncbi:MAG: hypothetical protein K2L86_11745 [Lachnospiraceae bacterium]|nr:hypothetical protein [Lachnospiraceae bacterium]
MVTERALCYPVRIKTKNWNAESYFEGERDRKDYYREWFSSGDKKED